MLLHTQIKIFVFKDRLINLEVQYAKLFRHLKVGIFKTRERYGKAFKRFMVFLAQEYNLQKLSNIAQKHIFAYVEYMQDKGLSPSTIKTELAAIRFFHDSMPYTSFTLPTNDAQKALDSGKLFVKGKGGLIRYVPIYKPIKIEFEKTLKNKARGQKLFVDIEDKTHLAMKRLQNFIAYHRKEFTENRITFHGLRHTYAHEKYNKFIKEGCSEYEARKKVSELLGHHRDDVTRIYLAE